MARSTRTHEHGAVRRSSPTAEPDGLLARGLMLAVAFPVLAIGVAGYLGSGTGAGPTEAAAIAFDPPVPFRWSYGIVQGGGALTGWLLGAAIGVGTILVIILLGPMVDLMSRQVRTFRLPAPSVVPAPVVGSECDRTGRAARSGSARDRTADPLYVSGSG
jgi:hypothetical protein